MVAIYTEEKFFHRRRIGTSSDENDRERGEGEMTGSMTRIPPEIWVYNLFDKERFINVALREGVTIDMDFGDENSLDRVTAVANDRVDKLKNGVEPASTAVDDITGFNFLRLVAAVAGDGSSWLVHVETDLFKKRIEKLDSLARFVNTFMFNKTVITDVSSAENSLYTRPTPGVQRVKVRWDVFSDLIAGRKYTVRGGWIYTTSDVIVPEIVKLFKAAMEGNITETRRKIRGTDTAKILEQYAPMIDNMVKRATLPAGAGIDEIMSSSPPCIRLIDSEIASGVHVTYEARLIIAFFLKRFVDRGTMIEYFYRRNPDNVREYQSAEDFMTGRKELDYIFHHMYGETGGGTSYKSYGCKGIKEEGECPFVSASRAVDAITELEREKMETLDDNVKNRVIAVLSRFVSVDGQNRACGFSFQIRYYTGYIINRVRSNNDIDKRKFIPHPMAYIEDAIKLKEKQASTPGRSTSSNQGNIGHGTSLLADRTNDENKDDEQDEDNDANNA
jgi:DNA primase large subunit